MVNKKSFPDCRALTQIRIKQSPFNRS